MRSINLISRSYAVNFFHILENENGSPLLFLFYKKKYGYILSYNNKFLNKEIKFQDFLNDETYYFFDFDNACLFITQNLKKILKKIIYTETEFNISRIQYLESRALFLKKYSQANIKLRDFFKNKNINAYISTINKITPHVVVKLPFFDYENIRMTDFFDSQQYSLSISTGSNGKNSKVINISIYPIHEYKDEITADNLFVEIYEKIICLEYNCAEISLKEKMKEGK